MPSRKMTDSVNKELASIAGSAPLIKSPIVVYPATRYNVGSVPYIVYRILRLNVTV